MNSPLGALGNGGLVARIRGQAKPMGANAKPRKKADLPQKVCASCGRPFTWRKKWAAVWEEVRYCSQRCRRSRPDKGER